VGKSAKEGDPMSVRNKLQTKRFGSGRAYLRRVVAASMAGTVVEWYEFFLYGTAATLVFSKVFFPKGGNELDAILAAFITYAVRLAASCSANSAIGTDARSCCSSACYGWAPPPS
jgi:hypothetical protein